MTSYFPCLRYSLVMIAMLFGLVACAPPEPLQLGFLGGLSGRVADLGIAGRNGAMLAVELRNQAGGVKGRQIKLLVEDDQQNPDVARKATSKLIDSKVEAIIGPMTSSMATAVLPLANAAQVLLVSPTATTNVLSGLDDYFFRVVSATHEFARKSADYHYRHAGVRRVAAVYDLRNKAYTESWLKDYRAALVAVGGNVVDSIGFSSGDETHYTGLARSLLSSKPDGVLIVANSVDAAMLCQQVRKINPSIAIVAAEWSATERLIELGGRSVEGIVSAQFIDRQSTKASYIDFRRKFLARFNKEPGFAGLTAFDAVNVVLDGLDAREQGQSLKQSLLQQKSFNGAQTPVEINAFGDASRATYLTTIRDGAFVSLR